MKSRKAKKREFFWLEALPVFSASDTIPRIIHQIFPTLPLPSFLQHHIDELKARNPGWEHRLYDEESCQAFIREHYGEEILRLYLRIAPLYGAARGDLARYLIVYAVGGVYLDIKSYFDRPIGDVISESDGYILAQWGNRSGENHPGFGLHPEMEGIPGGEFQQWHVIAAPAHPYLRAVIAKVLANVETYRPWLHGVGRSGVLRVTGPIAYTSAIAPVMRRHPHRMLASSGAVGLHYSIGEGYNHLATFPNHYSLQTGPVVKVPLWAKPAAAAYGYAKGLMQRKATAL